LKYGQHLRFEHSIIPLSNLCVSVLNHFGLADKKFDTAISPLKRLELV